VLTQYDDATSFDPFPYQRRRADAVSVGEISVDKGDVRTGPFRGGHGLDAIADLSDDLDALAGFENGSDGLADERLAIG
jgi:hypothetical protein